MEAEKRTVQGELHAAEMRLELLPKLLKNLYEDKVSGRMMEEDYAILSREYAEERETLKKKVKAHRDRLRRIAESEGEREQFIKAIRKFMEMRTLTNQILRELIDHIDVYEVEGRGKNRTQRMVIYYKFVTTRPICARAWRWSTSPVSRRKALASCSTRSMSRLKKSNKNRSRRSPAPGT